jgi:hypothetical protein
MKLYVLLSNYQDIVLAHKEVPVIEPHLTPAQDQQDYTSDEIFFRGLVAKDIRNQFDGEDIVG